MSNQNATFKTEKEAQEWVKKRANASYCKISNVTETEAGARHEQKGWYAWLSTVEKPKQRQKDIHHGRKSSRAVD